MQFGNVKTRSTVGGWLHRSPLWLAAIGMLLALSVQAQAASIKNVQTGEVTFTAATQNVTITSVDLTKSILIFSERNNLPSPQESCVRGQLTSATNLRLAKNTATGSVTVRWYVAEFDSGITVQRGTTALAAATVNVAITSVSLTSSFVIVSKDKAGTGFSNDDFGRARLSSATNLELVTNGGSGGNADWQVITFTGSSVQRNILSMASGTATSTTAITSVDLSRSILLFSYHAANGTASNIGQKMLRGRFSSATQLEFTRDNTGATISIAWEAIELPVGNTVQSAISSMSGTTTQNDVAISTVDLTRSLAFSANQSMQGQGWGRTSYSANDNPGLSSFTHQLLNATTLRLTRATSSTGTTSSVSYFVVDFARAGAAPVLAAIGPRSVNENANLNFIASATDADGTIPALSAINLPASASFVDNGNGTGTFNWTPSFSQSGVYNVTFIASDGALADSEVVAITVNNVNQAPVLAAIGPKSVNEGVLLTFNVSATDADGTIPTMSAVGVPLGASFVNNANGTGTFTWTPDLTQSGIFNVTFIASDGTLADSEVVAITVNNVNQAPILAAIGAKSVDEGVLLTFNDSATDPDATIPVMSAVGVPAGASFVNNANGTGTFTWTPSFAQSGVFNVTFIASDGTLADSEVVAITVNDVNQAPVLAAIGPKSVNEGVLLTFSDSAADGDGTIPTMSAVGVPAGASFINNANGTGTFTWTPDFTQSGAFNVTFIASDGTLADSEVVVITVNNVNQAPVLAAIGPKSVNEGVLLTFNDSATDPDATTPAMSAVGVPLGASFIDNANGTGTFSWTPTFTQSGVFNVTFIASDGNLADSEVVAITVSNVNQAPVLAAIGPKSVNEGVLLTFNDSATDPDGTTPAMTAVGVPLGATFVNNANGTGTFTWTPDFTQSGVVNVTFIASDGSLADSEVVAITVNDVNQPPVLAAIGPKNVNEGVLLNFNTSATDGDGAIPSMTAANLPLGASYVNNGNGSGTFNWTPSLAQSGVHNVTFIASDGSLADSEVVAITVNNVNQAPVLAAIGAKNINEGALLTFSPSASDPDATTPAMTAVGLPSGASYLDNGNGTGTFDWTPSFAQSGVVNVTFITSDGTLADSEVVAITVNNVNQAPVLAAIGPKSVNENANLNFNISASDFDGSTPTFAAENIPTNATFTDNGNGTGTFDFNPDFTQSGVYNVRFIASDGALTDTELVAITVNDVSLPPVLAAIGPKTVDENVNLNFSVSASDPDLTMPTLSAAGVPLNATFTDNGNGTGTFDFTPSYAQSGIYNVTFIASDGVIADSEVVAITVNNVNRAPILAAIGPKNVNEGVLLSFNDSATDPDGTTPTMTAANLPVGAAFVDNADGTGTFNFTPDFTQAGVFNVTFVASDGSLADSEVVAITVNNVNRAPVLTAIGPKSVAENANLNFSTSATDPDLTTPILTAAGLPVGATYTDNGNGTATFDFTPDFTQAGVFNVTFIASDGALADSEVVAVTVTNTNRAPVLAAIGAQSVTEGANLNLGISSSDPDGATPTLSALGVPLNATFTDNGNGSGTFNFNPTFVQAGVYNVTFVASDGALADSEVVAITVNEAGNQRPVLTAIGPKSVTENANLSFNTSASDVDGTNPIMTAVGVPANATYTDNGNGTGSFSFDPDFTQSGVLNVIFIASDGLLADSETVAITVNNVNLAPVLAAIGPQTVAEGANLSFGVGATDPDVQTPILTALTVPTNASFTDNGNGTGSFVFDPDFSQSGVFNVTFIASDGVLADSEVVAITVTNVNRAPVLAAIGPRNVNEGANLSFVASATDPDGATPTLSAINLPLNASFIDNGNGTGSFSFDPDFAQSGIFNVTFIASDGSLSDSEVVAITVNNVNLAPVLASIGPRSVSEGVNLNFTISATDFDATVPTLSAQNVPTNATFTDNGNGTGTFDFNPDFTQSGVFNVLFIASDGTLADSETVAITVTEFNRPPVLAAIGPKSVNENANLNFGVSASDLDLTTPTLSAVGVPLNSTFTDNGNGTGTFDFNPDFTQSGVFTVTFIASDGFLADSEVVAITVNNVNLAPVLATIGPKSVAEGTNLNFNATATDPDATVPTLSAVGVPLNATFVDNLNGTGTFNFSPDFTQSGVFNVTFIAFDGALADSEVVAITVNNQNLSPILAGIGPKSVSEGANLNFGISASDPDLSIPALSAVGIPVNATFTDNLNGTGTFNFNPDFTQSGVINVTFIATDGSLADSEVVAITVSNVNLSPVLAAIGAQSVNEGAVLNFNTTASDPDLTVPTLNATGVPLNATFTDNLNGTGTFNFAPNFTQSGVFNVTIIASDGSLADSEVVAITVNNVNLAPVLAAIGPKVVAEGAILNFNTTATDPDASIPTLTALSLPLNATFTDNLNGSGTFNFNPDFTQSGVYNVTFIASDGVLADSEVVSITVSGVNLPPVFAAIGSQSVNEGANLNFGVSASDPDLSTPSLSAVNLPLNATFTDNLNGTGTFDFSPDFTQSGVINVTFIATDGLLADSEVVAITVNNVNRAPVLAAIGPKSVSEGVLLTFGDSAIDPDGSTPSMSAVGVPSGASFVDNANGTGTFSWTPNFTQSGVFNVTFITSDGSLADSEVVAITVNNVNLAPVLASIGPRSVTEGAVLNFSTSATDADGTTPSLVAQNLPTNASFVDNGNGTGSFSFSPDFVQAGVYNVRFIASDGILADSETVVITVNDAGNQRPVLAAIGPKSVTEGQNLTFNITGTDPDLTTPTFAADNIPVNASLSDNGDGTATFSFDPSFVQAANYLVTFIASDGTLADSEVVVITVNEAGNQRPVLAAIGPKTVGEGANLNFALSATDADETLPTFAAVGLPLNSTLTNNGNGTATFNFNPNFNQAAAYLVTFITTDGSLADSEVVTITVTNTNRAPVLAAIGPKTVAEGANLNFNTSASDPDGPIPVLSAVGVPANATFINNGNGTGTFNFNPNFSQAGVYNVTFIASDGGLADSEVVVITVTGTNLSPSLAAIGPRSVTEGGNLNFATSATDPDGVMPTMTALNLPLNASYVDNGNGTGSFNFDPTFVQAGVYNVTFIASDGLLADSEIVAITVNEAGNQRPVLAAIGPKNVTEGAALNFNISATDPDLTTPTLAAENLPTGASFLDNGNGTGSFSFSPDFTQAGVYNVRFITSDGTLADSEIVAITVNDAGNQRPVLAAIGPQGVTEGFTLNFNTSATDADATIPAMTATNVPANATYTDNGDGTGSFSFTPTFLQNGVYNVTFVASDGSLADSEVVAITVVDAGNQAPVLASIGPKNVTEGLNLNFNISATDVDATTPTLLAQNLPSGASFVDNTNGTGSFNFTPDFTQSGVYNVRFIASDGALADTEIVAITVNDAGNQRPVLAAIGPKTVNEGAILNFGVSASDLDATIPALTAVNVPLNATFVDNANGTGTFSFNPDFTQSGIFNVTFVASDGILADSEVVAITVNNVNLAPVLSAIGPQTVAEGANLNFSATATDADAAIPALSALNVPTNATFTDNGNGSGTFNFNPNFTQAGVYNVTFIASDGALADSEVVAITVTGVNLPPVLASIGPKNVNEGANLNFAVSASDPDLSTPSLSAVNVPLNATFTDNGNGTGIFDFDPAFTQSGIYNVTFIASDGLLADSEIVAITVNNINLAPVLASIGPKVVAEGANLNFTAIATDPDATVPVMTALNVPLNATFVDNGNGSGTFDFNPDFTQSGVFNVTFIASDGVLADTEVVAITVNSVNLAPVLASIGPRNVNEGANLNFGVSATDPDLSTPALIAVNVPVNATFTDNGNGTGTFNFSPSFTQSGNYNVTFIASDGALADSEIVVITVNNVNLAPVLSAIGPKVVSEGANLNFNAIATDPDATVPILTALNVPLNATYTDNGNGTATFNFDPSFTQAGVFNVTFIASDGNLADSEIVAITVNNVNLAPILAAIGPKVVAEGANLNFNATATDADATVPALSALNVPLNATFVDNSNGTGTFNFNPNFTQSGVFNVTIIASDGALADSEVVSITVTGVNLPPELAAIGPKNVNEGANLNFGVTASDPDLSTPALSAVNVPLNATFTDNGNGTGTFNFSPSFTQAGVFNVTFIASDGALADSEVVAITVNNVNLAPVLAAIGPKSINEGAVLNFVASASDPDLTVPSLSAVGVPLNATFTDNGNGTGTFNFSPSFTQSGVFNVTFIASDGALADSEIVAITVNNVNLAPVLAAIGPKVVAEGANLNFSATASDADATTPTLVALNVPLNASFVDNGNGSGTFDFNPDFTQSGVFNVTFIASDGVLADSEVVSITVTSVNLSPVLASIGPKSVNEGANLNFGVSGSDPDLSTPVLSAVNVPLNATFTDNGNGTGSFNFNPSFTQAGVFNVTFIASDGALADSEVVAITVSNVNLAPILASIGPRSVNEGSNLNFIVSASDADATTPTLVAQSIPTNATFVDNLNGTGTFDFNPNYLQNGVYNVRFIASDGVLADTEIVTITVIDQGGSVPPARITNLMAQISANSIRLTWTPITTDSIGLPTLIDRYIIYRGTRAYFNPTPAESIGGVTATLGEFFDNDLNGANVVGDTSINYFYAVKVIDQIGRASNVSNRVGEYDYQMVITPSTDFNLAGLPFANTGLVTAQDVINSMGGTTNINTLNNFIPSSQSYQARFAAGFGTNFAVAPGSVFQVNVKQNFVWSIAGRVPDSGSTSYSIMTTPSTDYSLIMIPFEYETAFLLAQDVINSIPGLLNTLNEFLTSSQSYRSRFAAGFGTNFGVKAGRVYQANAAANGLFPAP